MTRRLSTLLVLAMLLTVLPLGTAVVLAAPPETTSIRITGLRSETAPTDGFARTSVGQGAERSSAVRAAEPFAMVGLELPAGASAEVRTSLDGTTWGPWHDAEVLGEDDGPDPDSAEAARASRGFSDPLWVGASRYVQVSVAGAPLADVEVIAIDPLGLSDDGTPAPPRTRLVLGSPAAEAASLAGLSYVSRAEWGADESLRSPDSPDYASDVDFAVIHHTAGSNDYTAAEAPAIVRGIYHYHTRNMGWDDIGYNVLVDRFGTVYEGRKGGLDRAVIGAHAAGYNTASFGISVMGNFVAEAPPEVAVQAVADTLAWKFRVHGIDAYGTATAHNGTTVDTLIAHRDVGSTACPGDAFYAQMSRIRGLVAQGSSAFVDTYGSVHEASIERIAAAGVTAGCGGGRYCPGDRVTRAQMATFLTRAFELEAGEPVAFSDVPHAHAHADGIAAAVAAGLASGYPDGSFRPEQILNREQMAAMLQRGLQLEEEDGLRYADTAASAYRGAINALSTAEITGGCDEFRFCPIDAVNRAQMASFLARTLTHLGR
ncbi:MAG: S-layer homology domain-containing protein [Actinobacteria bacterium]|nr:S-layer homology domain-containing protein [Actinomycetota bacterium]